MTPPTSDRVRRLVVVGDRREARQLWLNQSLLETLVQTPERAPEDVGAKHAGREEAGEDVALGAELAGSALPRSLALAVASASLGRRRLLAVGSVGSASASPLAVTRQRPRPRRRSRLVLGDSPRRRSASCPLSFAMTCFVPVRRRTLARPSGLPDRLQRVDSRRRLRSLGRGREARTPDLRIWNPLLYQLSYTPSRFGLRLFLYFVSRCSVCCLHCLQNFLSSSGLPAVRALRRLVVPRFALAAGQRDGDRAPRRSRPPACSLPSASTRGSW